MSTLISALALGLILALLALAILISFRIFAFADITTDGSLLLGAAVSSALLVEMGLHPLVCAAAGFVAGSIGGVLTAVLYTRCNINGLLAGILVIPSLFTVSRRLIPEKGLVLEDADCLRYQAARLASFFFGVEESEASSTASVEAADFMLLLLLAALVGTVMAVLSWFFRTELGVAMRAAGDNGTMARALGISVGDMTILGLALANGLAGLTGALLAQYEGRANLQMSVGMIVWGLASVLVGEALLPGKKIGRMLVAAVVGALLFRLLLTLVERAGLHPSDLKLFSAMFVLAALMLPRLLPRLGWRREVAPRA